MWNFMYKQKSVEPIMTTIRKQFLTKLIKEKKKFITIKKNINKDKISDIYEEIAM